MTSRQGTWVTYEPSVKSASGDSLMLATYSSEVNALRAAVDEGNKAIFVEFGETVQQALTRESLGTQTMTPKPRGRAVDNEAVATGPEA